MRDNKIKSLGVLPSEEDYNKVFAGIDEEEESLEEDSSPGKKSCESREETITEKDIFWLFEVISFFFGGITLGTAIIMFAAAYLGLGLFCLVLGLVFLVLFGLFFYLVWCCRSERLGTSKMRGKIFIEVGEDILLVAGATLVLLGLFSLLFPEIELLWPLGLGIFCFLGKGILKAWRLRGKIKED